MNRRQTLLTALTTASTLGLSRLALGDSRAQGQTPLPGSIPLVPGRKIELHLQSNPVRYKDQTFSLLSLGRVVFEIDKNGHLIAKLSADVLEWARVDYWVSVAVLDGSGHLLGTASHKEAVDRIELGKTLTVFREITLDFGISRAFTGATAFVVALSERDVPAPPEPENK